MCVYKKRRRRRRKKRGKKAASQSVIFRAFRVFSLRVPRTGQRKRAAAIVKVRYPSRNIRQIPARHDKSLRTKNDSGPGKGLTVFRNAVIFTISRSNSHLKHDYKRTKKKNLHRRVWKRAICVFREYSSRLYDFFRPNAVIE